MSEPFRTACFVDIPTQGLSAEAANSECRRRISLFVAEVLRRYGSQGVAYVATIPLDKAGSAQVVFDLPLERSVEIMHALTPIWDRFSGY